MREDYQTLIDGVSALLGTPALLEGRDFGLIAFGAHPGDGAEAALDPVRTRSILQRGSSSAVRAWFEGFGITRAAGPVRIPPDPSAGVVHGRICLPARESGVVHGYIWLLDDGVLSLDDPRLGAAMGTAARIGELLAARTRSEARQGELLRAVLTGDEGAARDEAETELRRALGPVAQGHVALVAVTPWPAPGAGRAPAQVPYLVAHTPLDGALAVLVRLRTSDVGPAAEAAERLLGCDGAPGSTGACAGVSGARESARGLRGAWRQARAAARAAGAERRFAPVARWDGIGPYRLLTELGPGHAEDAAVLPLLGHAHRELARTAEVFLDHAGQATRAATALGVHRQTLYYRLSRVERLTGLDLDDGEDRLLLHMALKTGRL
ncbi:PucR family transcriptional regulator [Streptomyces xiaopingdaonensis]|uniref:PucR family transcriptional regulator n=1 Tax=Streptomyces xiaopingdaonensis TaxID=1565415 RepID=UPI000303DE00|nr:helix-turn-helix domain-containing protein [Streptomyces xiaopingdaonensis]